MNFVEALKVMKDGHKVKLPSWGGYWYWDEEKQTVMIQCRSQDSEQGELLDIRETQRVEYTLTNVASDEWNRILCLKTIDNKDLFVIDHYYTKSWEEWCWEIGERGSCDPNYLGSIQEFFVYNPDMKHLDNSLDVI